MTPGRMPLSLYRGDTYRWRFSLWQDSARTQPVDLTGATVLAQVRDRAGGTLIATMSCTITAPNIIDAALSAEDSAKLPGSSVWDMQVTYAGGDVATVLAGPVNTTVDVSALPVVPSPHVVRAA